MNRNRSHGGLLRAIAGVVGVTLTAVVAGAAAPAPWTLMAYLDGSGELRPAAEHYREQLLSGEQGGQVRVLVQVNARADEGSKAEAVRCWRDQLDHSCAEQVGGDDAHSPEGLANFVKWSMQQAPAQRYALLIMGHGEWLVPPLSGERAAAGEGGPLSIEGIATALRDAERCAGSGPLEIVFLDCCHGATLEVIWELREVARYLVGPPGLMYSPGLPWGSIVQELQGRPQASGRDLAEIAVRAGGAFWRSEPDLPVALIAMDLARLESVVHALFGLSQRAVVQMPAVAPEIALARSRTVTWGRRRSVTDLGGFANVLAEVSTSPGVAQQAWEVSQAIREATVASHIQGANTRGKARGTGLGIFFPLNLEKAELPAVYRQTARMSEQSGWGRFLQSYLTQLQQLLYAGQGQV